MTNKDFFLALDELEKEKGIDKDTVLKSLETALAIACKRNFGEACKVVVKTNPEKYTECKWIAKGMSWIDPVKEVNANRIALETNQTTLQEVAAEQGKDWRAILEQRAKEKQLMKELGLEESNANQGKSREEPDDEE